MAFINTPKTGKEVLTADQVKQLPAGSKVTLHGCDRYGMATQIECTVVQSGRKKVLEWFDKSGFQFKLKSIQNYPNKYYTKGGADW